MTNPIDNRANVTRPRVLSTEQRSHTKAASTESPAAARSDASFQSNRLQAVHDAIERAPEIDSSRVADIRERIAQGGYPVNIERIAQRFTAFEKLLQG
ncbi:MAG: flagellar biosynthesis anti-sigma factor FlgM [Nitrococcus mobilis]|nr:flagellar biosynthesis anti-sigma factor FlgM [Nitrococcus mobilis]